MSEACALCGYAHPPSIDCIDAAEVRKLEAKAAPLPGQIPDYSRFLIGWKAWRLKEHHELVAAPLVRDIKRVRTLRLGVGYHSTADGAEEFWPTRKPFIAQCGHTGFTRRKQEADGHVPPSIGCSCGIYASASAS
jgi:hypothetical protein